MRRHSLDGRDAIFDANGAKLGKVDAIVLTGGCNADTVQVAPTRRDLQDRPADSTK